MRRGGGRHALHRGARAGLDATRNWRAADARRALRSRSTDCAPRATGAAAIFAICWSVIDWAVDDLRVSFVGLNPLHAIHNRRPFNTSPYLPNCIFYQNFLYLDVEGMEDYGRCGRAQRLRRSAEVEREIEDLRASEFVEYERVARSSCAS